MFAGYNFGPGEVEVFFGDTDFPSGDDADLSYDVTDYGISGSYQILESVDIYGSYLKSDVDIEGFSAPLDTISVGVDYAFNEQLALYGAIGQTTLEIPFESDIDALTITLGATYDLSAKGTPVILSLEYSKTNYDEFDGIDADVDRISFGLTIPFGGNDSATPLNSSTRTARGDYRSAISALVNSF